MNIDINKLSERRKKAYKSFKNLIQNHQMIPSKFYNINSLPPPSTIKNPIKIPHTKQSIPYITPLMIIKNNMQPLISQISVNQSNHSSIVIVTKTTTTTPTSLVQIPVNPFSQTNCKKNRNIQIKFPKKIYKLSSININIKI